MIIGGRVVGMVLVMLGGLEYGSVVVAVVITDPGLVEDKSDHEWLHVLDLLLQKKNSTSLTAKWKLLLNLCIKTFFVLKLALMLTLL